MLMKDIDTLTKDEKSLILYFEDCLVNQHGYVVGARMNNTDFEIAKRWNEEKFISFHRIPFHDIDKNERFPQTHWVRLSEDAWTIAHQLRKERSERMTKNIKLDDDS